MICNVKDNTFYIKAKNEGEILLGFDNIYFNSIYHQKIKFRFLPNTELLGLADPEFITFDLNRPGDETIIETKIYIFKE